MYCEPITRLEGRSFVLRDANIDTDQIIPARFLTTTERGQLGKACFHDWRFGRDGEPTHHPLNSIDAAQTILIAGTNFGCGSSREHAPWALIDFGFRAVITARAADIFLSNALKNRLIVCEIDESAHARLLECDDISVTIDLHTQTIDANGQACRFAMETFARTCFIEGVDALGYILSQAAAISRYEQARET